ncbi:sensor histidine kinase [Paenalkalicoccus suaedae]|uniref:Sensor histidine kinase n=2 Tax=Paenalkalicoccus suaedae TaxID=2592382 RepID=A0A859FKM5_9BACI|nr:sensor histidine kinase [Paenalkalicoccus suaedae]
MLIVLISVGALTYSLVSEIIKDNARGQIEQTAAQALGRIDSQFETIEMITSQISTDPAVQQLLNNEQDGIESTFNQRQSMNEIINSYQAFVTGLTSFELYFSDDRRLFPLNELPLSSRLDDEFVLEAQDARGRLIWAGEDPLDDQSFLTIKQITLFDQDFRSGGYLLTKVNNTYFNPSGAAEALDNQNEFAVVLDQYNEPVVSNLPSSLSEDILFDDQEVTIIDGEEFVRATAQSDQTGWSLVIFTPTSSLLQGIAGIGTAILVAGIIGLFIFMVASIIVSNHIAKPLKHLTHAMRFGTLGALKKSQRFSSTKEVAELNETYNKMVETTNHLIKTVYEKELLSTKAELKALQAQINPHFLYNTLGAIHWTLEERDEEMADMIISLSDLFRYTIASKDGEETVTLKEELQHTERYMQIMKLRFDDKLSWTIELPEEFYSYLIPKLLVQPVIENALLHGIESTDKGGDVRVIIRQAEQPTYMEIEVIDNGRGMSQDELLELQQSLHTSTSTPYSKGTGLAMRNLYQRLILSYPDSAHKDLIIESVLGEGTRVLFILPKEEKQHENTNRTDRG